MDTIPGSEEDVSAPAGRSRFRRQWGISPRTRYQLGRCDAMASAIRAMPLHPDDRRRLRASSLVRAARAIASLQGDRPGVPVGRDELAEDCAVAMRWLHDRVQVAGEGDDDPLLDADMFLGAHLLLAGGPDDRRDWGAGGYRTGRCATPEGAPDVAEVPTLVGGFIAWLNRELAEGGRDSRFGRAVVRALAAHAHILALSPFRGGNRAAAALIEGHVLAAAGCPTVASHVLPELYLRVKEEYAAAMDRCRRDRSLTSFVEYGVAGLAGGVQKVMAEMADASLRSSWRCLVRERLDASVSRKRSVLARRRQLILALPLDGALGLEEMMGLNTGVAEPYADLSRRTLRRDLAFLRDAGLVVEREGGGWSANTAALRPGGAAG